MPRRSPRALIAAPELDAALRESLPPAWRAAVDRRLAGLRRRAERGKPVDRALGRLRREAEAAAARCRARSELSLIPRFDQDLPVVERRQELAEAIRDNPVVVVCGETGSGKSTQLPQICLELGLGRSGCIAHTQPRRIAARSLCERIASELGTETGHGVGYRVRFTDQVGPATRVKLLTDGMLLAETQGDPELAEYDTVIIDEAHERSLNIDFLLGYLQRLRARRPDLKLIITSATIDPERFARQFDGAPVVMVSGRTYPVDVRYRPLAGDVEERDRSLPEGVLEAVYELAREGRGDVLVFLPGEREIRETAEALRKHHPRGTEILPLYGRLSAAEQQRVFAPHGGRRVVLATNVAETSITVPGIRYVVDSGLVRLSRYSYRTKVQRLPVEPISQASADQRAGRCGRLGPGICIRLYAEEDYAERPAYTDPEILRANLATVILQMKYLGLGAVEDFPFIDPPDPRFVRDGTRLLRELGALDARERLTELGRGLARLPVDPRIARMLVAAEAERCLTETLVLAAALSIQDPRERPLEARDAADAAQQPWQDERSDFLGLLKLWADFREQARHLSRNKLRGWCREHFLSYLRMLEWRDVHQQLRVQVKTMGFRENDAPADYPALHKALLAGLLGNIGLKVEESVYQGPRNLKLVIHPGSGLAKRRPKWILAAELVETSRVFARSCAEIRPQWVEPLAGDLANRSLGEPFFEERSGRVGAFESVSLYGLLIVPRRRVDYARWDPAGARRVFIREALVAGRLRRQPEFLRHNKALQTELEALEARLRRREILVDEATLEARYDAILPEEVCDGPSLTRWLRRAGEPAELFLDREAMSAGLHPDLRPADYPERLELRGLQLPLRYHFEPGEECDGVTVQVPLAALNQLSPRDLEWLVPGLLQERAVALIKGLPKRLRKHFVPAPEFAAEALAALGQYQGSLAEGLRRELHRMTGVDVPPEHWDAVELPVHLQLRIEVLDGEGRVLAAGRDLPVLKQQLGHRAQDQFARTGASHWERTGLRRWDFGDLPERVEMEQAGARWSGYPALRDDGAEGVSLTLADSADGAERLSRSGVVSLFQRELGDITRHMKQHIPNLERLCLWYAPVAPCRELRSDILQTVFRLTFLPDGELPRTEADFRECLAGGRGELNAMLEHVCKLLEQVLERFHQVRKALGRPAGLERMDSLGDAREHLESLVYAGFLNEADLEWLEQLPRFLAGLERRLEKLERNPGRDRQITAELRPWWERYRERAAAHRHKGVADPELAAFRRLLEEWRISLFAQELGTRQPVSAKRLEAQWAQVR